MLGTESTQSSRAGQSADAKLLWVCATMQALHPQRHWLPLPTHRAGGGEGEAGACRTDGQDGHPVVCRACKSGNPDLG